MIYDGAHRLFNDFLSWETLKLYEEQPWPDELWKEFNKLGFTSIFSPDDQNGINARWTDAQIILKASGYHEFLYPSVRALPLTGLQAEIL